MNRRSLFISLFTGLLIISSWEFTAYAFDEKTRLLISAPSEIFSKAIDLYNDGYILDVGISLYRIISAFVLATLIGSIVGLAIGLNKITSQIIEPYISFFRYTPIVGFIPISILWLGIDNQQKISIIFLGTILQFIPMVSDAVMHSQKYYFEIGSTITTSKYKLIRHFILPPSLPRIFDSARICLGIAWTYLVVAEIVAAQDGIGYSIMQGMRFLDIPRMLVGIITIGFLGVLFDLILRITHKKLFTWHHLISNSQ